MTLLDWAVLIVTLLGITAYGAYRTTSRTQLSEYLRGGKELRWPTIGLSIMATQASAVTFLSTPGQGYEDGMRYLQFYFGLPLAMVTIAAFVVPRYRQLNVYTAYEFLENRFDLKTRMLTAFLFLVQRGLAAGLNIAAPAIVFSAILGWPIPVTTTLIGALVVIYIITGGAKAIAHTQRHQMTVIVLGLLVALVVVIRGLPEDISLLKAVQLAGKLDHFKIVDTSFNVNDRYNIWSGLFGGFFLAMAYFGTDQSQVERYIAASSTRESRLGLLFNGVFKIPFQFLVLFIGVMVFVFYQFVEPPIHANPAQLAAVVHAGQGDAKGVIEQRYHEIFLERQPKLQELLRSLEAGDLAKVASAQESIRHSDTDLLVERAKIKALIKQVEPSADTRDTDYVFISFILHFLPKGIVGLLIAVIFCAAMSTASSELSALATTSIIDFYRRKIRPNKTDAQYVLATKIATVGWTVLAVLFANIASRVENLIQAMNILGSLFYGSMLGIFVVAFLLPRVQGTAVFWSAIIAEGLVILLFATTSVGFLWFNVIGCLLVVGTSVLLSKQPQAV